MKNFVGFYQLIRKLKLIKRQGWKDRDINADTISEHIYGAMSIGWRLAMEEGANHLKVIELLLVHDWVMSIIPDVTPSSGKYNEKDKLENQAKTDIVKIFDRKVGNYYLKLFEEFKSLNTLESKVARESDKLETLIQGEFFEIETKRSDILDEFLKTYHSIFTTKSGKLIFNGIKKRHLLRKNNHLDKTLG